MGIAAGAGFFHIGPIGEPLGVPHPHSDSGDGPLGRHHADDPKHDAGGAPAVLYPHRLGLGTQGTNGRAETRHQKCPHPGHHTFS